MAGVGARRLVSTALERPLDVPPLSAHVVEGDRVTVAVCGEVAQESEVVAAVAESLRAGGVSEGGITILRSADFAEADDTKTSYLAADSSDDPIHMARELVDADAVVVVGEWGFDASLAGRAIDGEIWPAFSRRSVRHRLVARLLDQTHEALLAWRTSLDDVMWQMGILASLRIVPGRSGTIAEAVFGTPGAAGSAARRASVDWRPVVAEPADLAIASLHGPHDTNEETAGTAFDFERLVRGVAAAARVTSPDGTICVCSQLATPPGPVFTRWRQGVSLAALVREAEASENPSLEADAFLARRFRRALGDRRLVLLSRLDQDLVEDLEFGFAESPATVRRLARSAQRVAVLHEADRLLPRLEE